MMMSDSKSSYLLLAFLCVVFSMSSAQTLFGAEGEHGHSEQGHAQSSEPNPLAVDMDLAIWTGIVFVMLMAVLGKFAWPVISEALEERERNIAENIKAAEAKHEEAKQLLAQHEAKLANTAQEIRQLLDEARRGAEQTKGQIIDEAKKAAETERERAVREIDLARNAALQDLAVTSANLAIDLARKVVKDQLNSEQQSKIVREALSKLAVAEPSEN